MKHYMTTAKIRGVSRQEVINDAATYGYPSMSTTYPVAYWNWGIFVHCPWDATGSVTDVRFRLRIDITYYCQFAEQNLDQPIN